MLSFDRHVYLYSSHLRKTMALVLHNTDNANIVIPLIYAEVLAGILYMLCYEKSSNLSPCLLPSLPLPPWKWWVTLVSSGVSFCTVEWTSKRATATQDT